MLTRAEFRKYGTLVLTIAGGIAGWSKTTRDDQAVELLGHIFNDAEHFAQICDIIGIPPDPLPATPGKE